MIYKNLNPVVVIIMHFLPGSEQGNKHETLSRHEVRHMDRYSIYTLLGPETWMTMSQKKKQKKRSTSLEGFSAVYFSEAQSSCSPSLYLQ